MTGMTEEFMLACTLSAWQGDKRKCRWCNDPITPPRYRWCSNECGKASTHQHWYREAAHAVRIRDNHQCTRCDSKRLPLHVHHIERAKGRHQKTSCVHHQDNLVVLCSDCHKAEHAKAQETPPEQVELGHQVGVSSSGTRPTPGRA